MELQHIHPEPSSFLRKHVFSTDHKVIAKQFLWAGLLFLAFGGALAMLIRWQWAYPGQKVPLLGDVPVLGRLFKTTTKTDNKDELLIFVTPRILQDLATN